MTSDRLPREPFYPILSPEELPDIHDLRGHLPQETQNELTEHDTVIHIVTPEISRSTLKPSTIREILRLTNASQTYEIGHHGAPLAGLSSSENSDVEALRKFEVVHGRDALEIALKLHRYYPELLRSTITTLAKTQGTTFESYQQGTPYRQEEPGKIMLLNREPSDPIGQKFSHHLNWGWPFYGSVDATPSFITAIATYARSHDPAIMEEAYITKDGEINTIKQALDRSTEWILQKIENSPEGLIEFKNTDPHGGMSAQAWKDSAFAYVHSDGSRANHNQGIASVEIQSRTYDALLDAAELHAPHNANLAAELTTIAHELKDRIFQKFWVDTHREGFFALGTDYDNAGNPRQLAVRSSNMGHLLNSRLLEGNENGVRFMRDATIKHLFTPELLHESGIRTLASDETAFRPGGYHTGSVWLWDTAYIADGLERHNFHQLAWELRKRIQRTIDTFGKFPEFIRSAPGKIVTNPSEVYVWNSNHKILHLFEQPPQEIQGWSVSAALAAKRAWPQYAKKRHTLPTSALEQTILKTINQ